VRNIKILTFELGELSKFWQCSIILDREMVEHRNFSLSTCDVGRTLNAMEKNLVGVFLEYFLHSFGSVLFES
jgi:hypothetical protein